MLYQCRRWMPMESRSPSILPASARGTPTSTKGYYTHRKPHFPLVLGYDGSGALSSLVGSRCEAA